MSIKDHLAMLTSKGSSKDATPQKTSLKDVLAKQGVIAEVYTKIGEGSPKPDETPWIEAEESKLKDAEEQRKSRLNKTFKELQKDGAFKPKPKIGGNYDAYGNLRKNVGGRPRKHTDQSDRNMSRKQRLQAKGVQKEQRKEILGTLQKEMCERLDVLEEKYPMVDQRPLFWKEARKIVGDLDRCRIKQMRKNYNKICKRVERTKAGATGAKKRGANNIENALQDSYRSKAIRDSSTGHRWLWNHHEKSSKDG